MDVRIVGIPVIDCDPVESCAEIPLGICHQFARERPKIVHVGCILGRNDEAEVVAIVLTSLGKRALVGHVGLRIEQTGVGASAGDAIPLKVSDMLGERRRAESMSAVPDHPRLDHDPTRRRTERQGKCRGTTSTEPRAGIASLPAKAFPGVTGLPGGPHDLTNKALRPGRSTPSVANTAGSDMQVIVARIHSGLDMPGISDGSGAIVFSDTLAKAPAGNFVGGRKSPSATVTSARQQSALL